jgi:ATP-dependent DNA helicase RecQ
MVVNVLHGGKSEKIREADLNTLSTYGIMADMDTHRIRLILDFLIGRGYLAVEGDEYPVLRLTPRFREITAGKTPLTMMLPREAAGEAVQKQLPAETVFPVKAALARSGAGKNPAPFTGISRNMAAAAPDASPPKAILIKAGSVESAGPGSPDEVLFTQLKELRTRLAQEAHVPAYIVFSDASLRDMCRKQPVTREQFLNISGVGAAKMEKYGDLFIRLIREYGEKN